MAGIGRAIVAGVMLLANAGIVEAFHGRFGVSATPAVSYYYYYVPTYSYYPYCLPPLALVPLTVQPAPGVPYAIPTPAPASQTIEPPFNKAPMPPAKVQGEPRGPTSVMVRAAFSATERDACRVCFWNLSTQDRTVSIEGRPVAVAKGRSITVDVPRRFAWQLEERPQRVERVPDEQTEHDVVIRD